MPYWCLLLLFVCFLRKIVKSLDFKISNMKENGLQQAGVMQIIYLGVGRKCQNFYSNIYEFINVCICLFI